MAVKERLNIPKNDDVNEGMKCSTSCVQAQVTRKDTGETFTYRDCGTYLLQEFGQEKINLSYTQYAMILTDTDDIGNTWLFKFCNKEKCLCKFMETFILMSNTIQQNDCSVPSDYNIDDMEDEKGNAAADVEACDNDASSLLLIGFAIAGVIAVLALLMKAYSKWSASHEHHGTGNNRVSARMNMNGEQISE
ncbi:hypothetical protein OESDEN_02444 [Oesophagostomum dentatum]|uniref:Uncharacterized protein n=1 Tax=Oesophagostomum dentatum TaxID=61180 RepID=A0A0B1TQC0_OESDE|nr:hypothetical protein OESDEN_02444 [Oesophagostomum dentatum]